jgi:monoamine oxidase
MQTDTIIIGGGLSGLSLAARLAADGHDFLLAEARDRLGGRILTERLDAASFDLGPAWFWPGQPRIAALIEQLNLSRFEQFSNGELTYEDEQRQVLRGRGHASMEGSWRLHGGLAALIDALAQGIPAERIHMATPVKALARSGGHITASTRDGTQIRARRVVLALPPRVAAGLSFLPDLPGEARTAMQGIATWMAGQAKALAVYDRPFWREAGLSGDAMSRVGPMVEIHDASPAEGGPYALFGFIGVPPLARSDAQLLRQQVRAQLGRLFGPAATAPRQLFLKDWAFDPFTATDQDQQPLYAHPRYGLPRALSRLWDGRLILAGTEVAPQFGGYLEGALEAAELAHLHLNAVES